MPSAARPARALSMLRRLLTLALIVAATPGAAAELQDYLPGGRVWNRATPTPASVLGFEVGERHVRPDQLVRYLEVLAESSERMRLETIGHSHEGRPLVILTVTSPENQARLEDIRTGRLEALLPSGPDDAAPTDEELAALPSVLYLAYGVHGNEASGSNAALAVAYFLAASQGPAFERRLQNTVILLDPSLNPDGLGRFAHWVNMHRGNQVVADPEHREHREPWPNGRTNHYWFDLNRDWLPAQHPESRARLEVFHRWKPNLLGDFHEMGTNSTYFFQPGVPTRQNPRTPQANLELTRTIARFHAEALDQDGRLYYTEETFDDFYPGKGSTYPDLNGSVGILFEQASARGHAQRTTSGLLTFPFAIQNQVRTSLSMFRAALEHRQELLRYQADFFHGALREARVSGGGAYLISLEGDVARTVELLQLLQDHQIRVHTLRQDVTSADGRRFSRDSTFAIPRGQAQHRLIESLFDTRTSFQDNTFYDVSTWNLALAFDAAFGRLEQKGLEAVLGPEVRQAELPRGSVVEAQGQPKMALVSGGGFEGREDHAAGRKMPYAYLLDWSSSAAPQALYQLLAAGVRVRLAKEPMSVETPEGARPFERGSLIVPSGAQEMEPAAVRQALERVLAVSGVDALAVDTGLLDGADLGSPKAPPLTLPRPLLVVGSGVSTYEAGEIWHLLDRRYQIPLSLVEKARLKDLDLSAYTHVLMVDGRYQDLPIEAVESLRRWVRGGGVLVATKRAAIWAHEMITSRKTPEMGTGPKAARGPQRPVEANPEAPTEEGLEDLAEEASAAKGTATREHGSPSWLATYADYEQERAKDLVSGAAFQLELDPTHPLAFGFPEPTVAVFRNHSRLLQASPNPYETPARYSSHPLLAGYASETQQLRIAGTPAVVAGRVGNGAVVRLADNPAFRSYWRASERFLLNALFFGSTLKRMVPPDRWLEPDPGR